MGSLSFTVVTLASSGSLQEADLRTQDLHEAKAPTATIIRVTWLNYIKVILLTRLFLEGSSWRRRPKASKLLVAATPLVVLRGAQNRKAASRETSLEEPQVSGCIMNIVFL